MINHMVQNINQGPRRNVYQSQQYTTIEQRVPDTWRLSEYEANAKILTIIRLSSPITNRIYSTRFLGA